MIILSIIPFFENALNCSPLSIIFATSLLRNTRNFSPLIVLSTKSRLQRISFNMEHLLGLLYSMLRYLPANSNARIRLLAKFVEKDYEKISLILAYRSRIIENWVLSKKQTRTKWERFSLEEQEELGGEEWLLDQLNERKVTLEVMPVLFLSKIEPGKYLIRINLKVQLIFLHNVGRERRPSLARSRRRRREGENPRRTSHTRRNATRLEKVTRRYDFILNPLLSVSFSKKRKQEK